MLHSAAFCRILPFSVVVFAVTHFVVVVYLAQKYLSLMMKPDDKVKHVKLKGLHHVDITDTDAETYLNTQSKKPGTCFGCKTSYDYI